MIQTKNNNNNNKQLQLQPLSPSSTPTNNLSINNNNCNNNLINPLPYITPPPAPRPSFSDRLQRSTFLFPKSLSSHRMMMNNNSSLDGSYSNGSSYYSNKERRDSSHGSATEEGEPCSRSKENSFSNTYSQPRPTTREDHHEVSSYSSIKREPSINLSSSSKKKSVRFQESNDAISITVHNLTDTPLASDMTPREKSKLWYTSNEYDQFKYAAAKEAGVKIVRYDSSESETVGHHFVMMGDFDGQYRKEDADDIEDCCITPRRSNNNLKIGAAVASNTTSDGTKCYYNENEYNDHRSCLHNTSSSSTSSNKNKESTTILICKRGLGYHFSRSRKKSRIITRSAVLAWQTTLTDPSLTYSSVQKTLPTAFARRYSEDTLCKSEKDTLLLALVSSKCSRVAREEARWRGDVDYRVAYPERHRDAKTKSVAGRQFADDSSSSNCGNKYQHHDDSNSSKRERSPSSTFYPSGSSSYKRQRRNALPGGCSSSSNSDTSFNASGSRDEVLSPATIGRYLNGMLHAEV